MATPGLLTEEKLLMFSIVGFKFQPLKYEQVLDASRFRERIMYFLRLSITPLKLSFIPLRLLLTPL